jgi:hypothetical protein
MIMTICCVFIHFTVDRSSSSRSRGHKLENPLRINNVSVNCEQKGSNHDTMLLSLLSITTPPLNLFLLFFSLITYSIVTATMNIIQFLTSLIAAMALAPLLVSAQDSTIHPTAKFENPVATNCLTDCAAGISGLKFDGDAITAGSKCFSTCLERNGLADNVILKLDSAPLNPGDVHTQIIFCEAAATATFATCMMFAWSWGAKAICSANYFAQMVPCVCCLP